MPTTDLLKATFTVIGENLFTYGGKFASGPNGAGYVWKYHIPTDLWTQIGVLNGPRRDSIVIALNEKDVLITGNEVPQRQIGNKTNH